MSHDSSRTDARNWVSALLLRQHERFAPRLAAALARWRAMPRGVRRRVRRRAALSAAGAALMLAMTAGPLVPPAHAAVITVNGTTCTLPMAIVAAQTDKIAGGCKKGTPGADVISLNVDVTVATGGFAYYASRVGLPKIVSPIVIEGNGHTIRRDPVNPDKFRLFTVGNFGDLTLSNVTLSGGYAFPFDDGTPYYQFLGDGGAVFNNGSLTLNSATLSGNQAHGDGGGIYNLDDVTLNNSVISGNQAGNEGGGIYHYSASGAYATLTLNKSTVRDNTAGREGGGIFAYDGIASIDRSTISGNTSGRSGGGVYSTYESAQLTITNSTVSGNHAATGGGVTVNEAAASLTNSTISGNGAQDEGGGLFVDYGAATLTHVTVTDNESEDGSGGGIFARGDNDGRGVVDLHHSVVSGNRAGVGAEISAYGTDVNGNDHNVLGHAYVNVDQAFYGFEPGATDVNATYGYAQTYLEDILEPLGDNGGPTLTHALPDGSPAIDLAPNGPAADQRNAARPYGGGYDAGAVEQQPSLPAVFVAADQAGRVGALTFGPQDILKWDGSSWTKWFDGAAAGLLPKNDVRAFWIPDPNGTDVVIAFGQRATKLADNRGTFDQNDLVWWDGSTYRLWFDGQDVDPKAGTTLSFDGLHVLDGLLAPPELSAAAGGTCQAYLLLSTAGDIRLPSYDATSMKVSGEDVLGFCMTQSGEQTRGQWMMVIDGSAEGMPANSTDSLSASADGQTIYLTTRGTFNVDAAAGGHSMVYKYDVASGTFSGPIFSGPAAGLSGRVSGLQLEGEIAP